MQFITKNDYMYQTLKKQILNGTLEPGTRLAINDIAKQYDISPMPVRDAVSRLSQEGLVQQSPHVGAHVSKLAYREVLEHLQVTFALECGALRLSCKYRTDKDIDEMERMLTALQQRSGKKPPDTVYRKMHAEFHLLTVSCHYNKTLINTISTMQHKLHVFYRSAPPTPEHQIAKEEEHIALLAALKAHDSETAIQLLRKHRISSVHRFLDYVMQQAATPGTSKSNFYLRDFQDEFSGYSSRELEDALNQYRKIVDDLL